MKITHVMRGEEFLPSVPKFISLHKALEIELPKFVTMPSILRPGGGKKLSKRDGAKDVLNYREEGYLPDAVFNFIASLGWNDGTQQEIYSPEEIIQNFDLSRIQKSGAQFDSEKLDWVNWHHVLLLADKNLSALNEYLKTYQGYESNLNEEIVKLAITKSNNPKDLVNQLNIFSLTPDFNVSSFALDEIDKDLTKATATKFIFAAHDSLKDVEDFSALSVETVLRSKMIELGAQPRSFLNLVRWAISGRQVSPNLFEMISLIGKDEVLSRLNRAVS